MNTRLLMISSAILLFGLGALFTFAPKESINFTGSVPQPLLVLLVQGTGALYLGFAILNWMAKDNLIGGIYSRPVALANFLHFVVFALAAIKTSTTNVLLTPLIVITGLYVLFAAWFGLVTFGGGTQARRR